MCTAALLQMEAKNCENEFILQGVNIFWVKILVLTGSQFLSCAAEWHVIASC